MRALDRGLNRELKYRVGVSIGNLIRVDLNRGIREDMGARRTFYMGFSLGHGELVAQHILKQAEQLTY